MKRRVQTFNRCLAAVLLAAALPLSAAAKSYSSGGGHSYSSSSHSSSGGRSSSSGSSHSFSSGGGHTFSSGGSHSSSGSSSYHSGSGSSGGGGTHSSSSVASPSRSSGTSASRPSSAGTSGSHSFSSSGGKSYTSGSTWSSDTRHSYTSGKSYTAGSGHTFASSSSPHRLPSAPPSTHKTEPAPSTPPLTFDTAAARARKEQASKQEFTRFKESQLTPPTTPTPAPGSRPETTPSVTVEHRSPAPAGASAGSPSYRVQPPPLHVSTTRREVLVPDADTVFTRPVRIYNVFNPYSTRPVVIYRDPYNSFFWWWLLDRSLDDRAWWAYHHRYDMDPARYQALVATDQQLEARVDQLEAQRAPRDPNYVPAGLDRDLMYSDQYVTRAYSNRPTIAGAIAFWVLGVPTALAVCGFFIWLIWFKRWQTSTATA